MFKLLDFLADWCGPCLAMKPVVVEVEKVFKGRVEFEMVNVDENQQKAQEFEVMSVPTFVLIKDGQEVVRKSGVMSKEEFVSWVEENTKI